MSQTARTATKQKELLFFYSLGSFILLESKDLHISHMSVLAAMESTTLLY